MRPNQAPSKSILYGAVAMLLFFGVAQVVTNPVTIPLLNTLRPLGGYNCADPAVYCVSKDTRGEYTVIGGATLGGGTTNAAGSAMAAVTGQTVMAPATVVVAPGRYDEAVVIDQSHVRLHLLAGAILRPTVASATDVNGGVIRVAPVDSGTLHEVENVVIIVDGLVHNDAYGSPEAAIQIGNESCTGVSEYKEVSITGTGTIVGHHDAIQWCGAVTGSVARGVTISGHLTIIGGRDNVVKKGNGIDEVSGVKLINWTNYCEDPNTDLTDAISGTVDAGAGSTTTFRIDSADDFFADDKIVGRRVVFGGGGLCGADGDQAWIDSYTKSTRLATFDPAASATLDDGDCTYAIDSVPNAALSPCTDIDWTTIAADQSNNGRWKITAFHAGTTGPTGGALAGDLLRIRDVDAQFYIRDFGPEPSAGCDGQGLIAGFSNVSLTADYGDVITDNFNITVDLEVDLPDALSCTRPVSAILTGISSEIDNVSWDGFFRVNNTGDQDIDMAAIAHYRLSTDTLVEVPKAVVTFDQIAGYTGTADAVYDYASYAGTIVTGDIITGNPTLSITTFGAPYPSSKKAMIRDTSLGTTDLDLTGDSDALSVPASAMIRISAGKAGRTIGGIAKGYDGRYWCGFIDDSNTVTWENQEATASAQDRIITGTGFDAIQDPDEVVCYYYDQDDQRWRIVNFNGDPNS